MASDESPSEQLARECLERVLGTGLHRVKEDDRPSPDFWCDTPEGRVAFEVKGIASSDWLNLKAGFERYQTDRATSDLSMHWQVMLSAEIAADRLKPAPPFPEDDEAFIARLAEHGLTVTRKAERVADFERLRQQTPDPVRLKGLVEDLIPDLQVLETLGITTTFGELPAEAAGRAALSHLARRTRNALCMATPANPAAGLMAGVFLSMGYSNSRTLRADTIADRIQAWFDTPSKSRNLVRSLERDEYDVGHAVLVLDGLEPEFWPAQEAGSFLPTQPLELPASVAVVWILLGACTLRYSAAEGWSEFRASI